MMDIKITFLTVAAVALSYNIEVNKYNTEAFSAIACQKFPVKQKELYHFVTFPDIADKWLNWMTYFSSADHKPIGIGKIYKAIIKDFVMHFKIIEFIDGTYLAMESNFLFRPRVELTFLDNRSKVQQTYYENNNNCPCTSATTTRHTSKLVIKLYFQRNSILFQYTLGTIFRAIFEYQLRESLQNLLAILIESDTCPNIFL